MKALLAAALIMVLPARALASSAPFAEPTPALRLVLDNSQPQPVIGAAHPDAAGNKHGFEDGMTVKINGIYHLIVGEMYGDPFWVAMRVAHWTSPDAVHWKREATLKETSGASRAVTGLPYESVWGSNAIYDRAFRLWNLFYVGYDSGGAAGGRIYRMVSTAPGVTGIGGPYKDSGIVLQPDGASQPWEGAQGTDSFYPYQVGRRWLALYGSHGAPGQPQWPVGVAESTGGLAGPWHRLPAGNPLPMDPMMVENPLVVKANGLFLAVFDNDVVNQEFGRDPRSIGYSESLDGVHWTPGQRLILQPEGDAAWSKCMRTPLGLVPEGKDRFNLLYTAEDKHSGYFPVGLAHVKLAPLRHAVAPAAPAPAGAEFVKTDLKTAGDWKLRYGSYRYTIFGDWTNPPPFGTVTCSGTTRIAAASSDAPGALWRATTTTGRLIAARRAPVNLSIDIHFTDATPHQVSIYLHDAPLQTVQVTDPGGKMLDTRQTVADGYLVWRLQGHVKMTLTAHDASINGIFVDW